MKEKNDGGPAFPCSGTEGVNPESLGMSLRDWFAGMALQGMLSNSVDFKSRGEVVKPIDYPSECFAIADAMLKAREQ